MHTLGLYVETADEAEAIARALDAGAARALVSGNKDNAVELLAHTARAWHVALAIHAASGDPKREARGDACSRNANAAMDLAARLAH